LLLTVSRFILSKVSKGSCELMLEKKVITDSQVRSSIVFLTFLAGFVK